MAAVILPNRNPFGQAQTAKRERQPRRRSSCPAGGQGREGGTQL